MNDFAYLDDGVIGHLATIGLEEVYEKDDFGIVGEAS